MWDAFQYNYDDISSSSGAYFQISYEDKQFINPSSSYQKWYMELATELNRIQFG